MVRGNHETCNRAGQGWYRYLDPNPYDATRRQDLQRPGERQRRQLQRSVGRLVRRHAVRRLRLGERAEDAPSTRRRIPALHGRARRGGGPDDPEHVQHLGGSPPDPRLHGGQPADGRQPGPAVGHERGVPRQLLPAERRDGGPRPRARLPGASTSPATTRRRSSPATAATTWTSRCPARRSTRTPTCRRRAPSSTRSRSRRSSAS